MQSWWLKMKMVPGGRRVGPCCPLVGRWGNACQERAFGRQVRREKPQDWGGPAKEFRILPEQPRAWHKDISSHPEYLEAISVPLHPQMHTLKKAQSPYKPEVRDWSPQQQ